jgi:hypothetical protein
MAIDRGTREFINDKSCNKTFILDEQLHAMELCIYHGIVVQVMGWEGEYIAQMIQSTGSQSWRAGDQWNDWVCVQPPLGRGYCALNGPLPWQLQQLFKINVLYMDGDFVEYRLPRALTTIPESSGNFNCITKFVQVCKPSAAGSLQVFKMWSIIRCEHLVPVIATHCKVGDG